MAKQKKIDDLVEQYTADAEISDIAQREQFAYHQRRLREEEERARARIEVEQRRGSRKKGKRQGSKGKKDGLGPLKGGRRATETGARVQMRRMVSEAHAHSDASQIADIARRMSTGKRQARYAHDGAALANALRDAEREDALRQLHARASFRSHLTGEQLAALERHGSRPALVRTGSLSSAMADVRKQFDGERDEFARALAEDRAAHDESLARRLEARNLARRQTREEARGDAVSAQLTSAGGAAPGPPPAQQQQGGMAATATTAGHARRGSHRAAARRARSRQKAKSKRSETYDAEMAAAYGAGPAMGATPRRRAPGKKGKKKGKKGKSGKKPTTPTRNRAKEVTGAYSS